MLMETYALADSSWHLSLRTDFNAYETYKTRLFRIDQVPQNDHEIYYGIHFVNAFAPFGFLYIIKEQERELKIRTCPLRNWNQN